MTTLTDEERREARNARRRAKRRADARFRMARHAALELRTWSDWSDDNPVTPEQVIDKTHAMYGNYRELRDERLTVDEAKKALEVWFPTKDTEPSSAD